MTPDPQTDENRRLFLRLSPETRRKIKHLADEQKRSLQGQAEFLIEEGIKAQERADRGAAS